MGLLECRYGAILTAAGRVSEGQQVFEESYEALSESQNPATQAKIPSIVNRLVEVCDTLEAKDPSDRDAANGLASKIWNRYWHSYAELIERSEYYQRRNEASYASRRRRASRPDKA